MQGLCGVGLLSATNPLGPELLMPHSLSTVRVAPSLDELPALVALVEAFAEQHELGTGDAFALTVAAEELFANTLRHSRPPATWMELSLRVDGADVVALYCDDGAAFDPTQQAAPDTTLSAEERGMGGLGIEIIRKTMHSLAYERVGAENRVTFRRKQGAGISKKPAEHG
jgi:anti-sigma regulatory factor (Ser/Thr protein kinase)